jgi:hypothetical protein
MFVGDLPLVVVENARLESVFSVPWYHLLLRAFPHAKAKPAAFHATAQVMRLVLADLSIKRKCHESAMSLVMEGGLKI